MRLEDNLCTCEKRLSSLLDSHEALRLSVVEERSNGEQERLINAQLLDELTKELDELRTYQTHTQAHMMSRDVSRGRQREYSTQISHLKQVGAILIRRWHILQICHSRIPNLSFVVNLPLKRHAVDKANWKFLLDSLKCMLNRWEWLN